MARLSLCETALLRRDVITAEAALQWRDPAAFRERFNIAVHTETEAGIDAAALVVRDLT